MHNASTGPRNRSLFQDWKGGKIALTTPLVSSAPKGAQLESLDKTCLGISESHPRWAERFGETMTVACREQKPLLPLLRTVPTPTPPLPPPLVLPCILALTLAPSSWAPPGLAGLGFLFPSPLGFCFAVCLVKGPWVVIETIFWL